MHSKPIRSAKAEDIDMDYYGYFNHEQNPTSAPLFQASIAIARDEANKVVDRLIEELLNQEK